MLEFNDSFEAEIADQFLDLLIEEIEAGSFNQELFEITDDVVQGSDDDKPSIKREIVMKVRSTFVDKLERIRRYL